MGNSYFYKCIKEGDHRHVIHTDAKLKRPPRCKFCKSEMTKEIYGTAGYYECKESEKISEKIPKKTEIKKTKKKQNKKIKRTQKKKVKRTQKKKIKSYGPRSAGTPET